MSDDRSETKADEDRERRLEDIRRRTSWDPEHDPDPVIRRMWRESQSRLPAELAQQRRSA